MNVERIGKIEIGGNQSLVLCKTDTCTAKKCETIFTIDFLTLLVRALQALRDTFFFLCEQASGQWPARNEITKTDFSRNRRVGGNERKGEEKRTRSSESKLTRKAVAPSTSPTETRHTLVLVEAKPKHKTK